MKFKLSTIEVILLCLTFYELSFVPHLFFLAFKYIVIFALLLKNLNKIRELQGLMTLVFVYIGVVVLSSVLNSMGLNTVVASAVYGLQIVTIYCVAKSYIERFSFLKLVNIMFWFFFCILLVNDTAMIFINYNFSDPGEVYIVGNKFAVSFLHDFELALFFVKFADVFYLKSKKVIVKPTNILVLVTASAFVVFICLKITCSTGLISTAVLIVLQLVPFKIQQVLSLKISPIVFVAIANILIFGSFALFQTNLFQDFITNVLGKSPNISGRFQIWDIIFNLIEKKPVLGYGYYSGIVVSILDYGNPQNGILKILIDTGIVGLVIYVLIVYTSLGNIKEDKLKEIFPFVAFFYSTLIASLVEINLTDMTVFMTLAIIFSVHSMYLTEPNLKRRN